MQAHLVHYLCLELGPFRFGHYLDSIQDMDYDVLGDGMTNGTFQPLPPERSLVENFQESF